MNRRSAFEIYLRTGRRLAPPVETKFNPNHDPKDGRFTFAGQGEGASVLRTMGLPSDGGLKPKGQSQLAKTRPQQRRPGPKKLRPIPGYPETGAHSWRAANDQVFIEAADKFNRERGLKPGDPKYVDPQFIKAWAMVESGGEKNKSAFLRDPLQVNNPGDYKDPKPRVTGLAKHQSMTPAISAEAALKWLEYKGYNRDKSGKPGPWLGYGRALQHYNARKTRDRSGVRHDVWYTREVQRIYTAALKSS